MEEERREGRKQVSFWLPEDLHRWLKARAAERGQTLMGFIVKILERARRELEAGKDD